MSSPESLYSPAVPAGQIGAASSRVLSQEDQLAADAGAIAARLDRLPPTRSVWKLVILLSCGFFFEMYDLLYTGYIAPGLVKSGLYSAASHEMFSSASIASFIASLFAGLFVSTIACGFLADRFGRRPVFTWSLMFYVVANVAMAFQHSAAAINFWRFLVGLGIGVELVTIGTYISELVPKQIRGRAFACEQAVGFAAVPIVALLAYLLVPHSWLGLEGWRWVVLSGAHGGILIWWLRRGLPESPRWLAQQGRLEEAERIVSELERKVAAEHGAPLPPPAVVAPAARQGSFSELWQAPYRKRTAMMIVFNLFQTVGYFGFANWVPTLLIKHGITVTTSLMYSSVIALAAPVGPLIGFLIADRFERKHVIVTMAGANIVCGLLFSQMSSALPIIVLGVCLTLIGNIISYSFHAYQSEIFPTRIRARAVGFVYSWSRFSAIFTAFFIATTLGRFGVPGVFVLIGAAMAVVMLVIGLLGPRTRGVALEEVSR
jgi:putative MFS transporter